MNYGRRVSPKAVPFTSTDEPKDSAIRMKCRLCGAGPSQRCRTAHHREINYFHDVRRRDFYELRNAEAKLADWNKRYGAQSNTGA